MICGNSLGSLDKLSISGVNFFNPQFSPPGIVRNTESRREFCSKAFDTNSLYSAKLKDGTDLKNFLLKNMDYRIVGDFRNSKTEDAFEKWWVLNAKAPIDGEFKKYDLEFSKAFQSAYNNFFDHRSFYKLAVDSLNQSDYLPKSLNESLRTETNLYLQILARTILPDNVENKVTRYSYLYYSVQNSKQNIFESMYPNTPQAITRLNELYSQYYNFIHQPKVNFEQYISHSKKIDTAINDALVATGLKRVATGIGSLEAEIEDFSRPSTSGTENSPKVYEDVAVANPSYKQRMAIAAVKGLRRVESEIRRFIRMRIALSQSLEVDAKELMADWENTNQSNVRSNKFNPFGGNRPTGGN
jgi:hypothetical protein